MKWHGNQYVRYEFIITALFWTVLWGLKVSVLALHWQLFTGLTVYKRWWMGVLLFVFGAYVGCVSHVVSLTFQSRSSSA